MKIFYEKCINLVLQKGLIIIIVTVNDQNETEHTFYEKCISTKS